MGLTSTFYAALSGLDTSSTQFQVIGNNISNVNTTGYKAQSALFQTEFSQTLSIGSAAQGISGGTNPEQLGLGTAIATIRTNFSAGSLQTTGINSDLAIEGDGFFITQDPTGQDVYTRNGAFSVNSQGNLVNTDGNNVQGYNIDTNFNIIPGQIGNISIPEGSLTVARATRNASIDGTLNSEGPAATQGTVDQSMLLQNVVTGVPVNGANLMTQVAAHSNPGVALFHVGDVITLSAQVGGANVPSASFTVTGTSTLAQFCTFLQTSLGLDTSAGLPQPGGVSIVNNAGFSSIQITGNTGTGNAISSQGNALSNLALTVNGATNPITWTQTQAANGESVNTTVLAYDSLGTPMNMGVTLVKESATNAGSTWRYYVKNPSDTSQLLEGDGTVTFNTNGQYVAATGTAINVNRANTGAVTPQQINLNFSTLSTEAEGLGTTAQQAAGLSTELSKIAEKSQDGVPVGTLKNFGVGNDGTITGTFSNGLTETLGQIALATFANDNGLLAQGNSNYTAGPNSGIAVIGAPQTMSAGSIQGGSLEMSNVDLSTEFVNMITTSTAFSANGRTITTADQMMQELLQMGK
jgi:flagellar hook protein FlgE